MIKMFCDKCGASIDENSRNGVWVSRPGFGEVTADLCDSCGLALINYIRPNMVVNDDTNPVETEEIL